MASESCKEFLTVKFHTIFKLFRYRVNASSNFAAVTFFIVFKMCRHRVNAVLVTCWASLKIYWFSVLWNKKYVADIQN